MRPDRIVVGTDNPRTTELIRALYEPFTRNHDRLVVMDIRSAELTKYAANAMLATKISFMNELAAMAERVGADIEKVRIGIGSDPRIGYSFIYPGIGYGGSCFPKDVKALIRSARDVGHDAELLRAVESVNERQKTVLVHKLRTHFNEQLRGRTFALWGLAFKPNTDDMREAPSRVIIDALLAAGASVRAYDPVASNEARRLYADAPHGAAAAVLQGRLRGGPGCRCAADRDRMEGISQPRLRPAQDAAAAAADLRRPQPVRPGADAASGLRVFCDRPWPGAAGRARRSAASSPWRVAESMLVPVILSGGAGTRLWPLSRELYPKQLLPLVGRAHDAAGHGAAAGGARDRARRWWCATRRTAFWSPNSCARSTARRGRSCSSRAGRNTAPAIALAAHAALAAEEGDPLLLVLPADHVIRDVPAFHRAIETAS